MSVRTLVANIDLLSKADFLRFKDALKRELGLEITPLALATTDYDMKQEDTPSNWHVNEVSTWHIIMTGYNGSKIQAIKVLRQHIADLGLKEAKDMCDDLEFSAEVIVKSGLDYNKAMSLQHVLQNGGVNYYTALR